MFYDFEILVGTETLCARYTFKEWVQPAGIRPATRSKWQMNWRAQMQSFLRKSGSLPALLYNTQKAVFCTLKSDIAPVKRRKIRYISDNQWCEHK